MFKYKNKRKTPSIVILLVVLSLMLTSCYSSNRVKGEILPYPVYINNITVEKQPKAVASLAPSLTAILNDIGYTDKIVGYSNNCAIPENATTKETMGTALKPNMEKIGELKPEIIFTTTPFTKAQMDLLTEVNIKVVVMPVATSIDDLITQYLNIITVMSGQIEAATTGKALMDETKRQIDFIKSKLPQQKLSFLYVSSLDPFVATGDTYESDLISQVAVNVANDFVSYTVPVEELKKMNPDVIFFATPLKKENIEQNDIFKEMNAVKNNKLIEITQSELFVQTKDVANIIRQVASKIYPDINFNETNDLSSTDTSSKDTSS